MSCVTKEIARTGFHLSSFVLCCLHKSSVLIVLPFYTASNDILQQQDSMYPSKETLSQAGTELIAKSHSHDTIARW